MLTPDNTYTVNGVLIKEKIIPDGTRWTNSAAASSAGYKVGDLYKKNQRLNGGTGKVEKITIHNTTDLENVYDDGEQYTRATWPNQAMKTARVHYYVDDICAWQNLKAGTGMTSNDPKGSAEVGWHANDGSIAGGGNMTSIGIEIIMNDKNPENDAKAYDNGARLAAWLLYIHGLNIDDLVTHSYWNAKKVGKANAIIDRQCVTWVSGEHWCPFYIFNSKNEAGAYDNWIKFKAVVKKYLDALRSVPNPNQQSSSESPVLYRIQVGAFRNYNYAAQYLAEVQKFFPNAYITTK